MDLKLINILILLFFILFVEVSYSQKRDTNLTRSLLSNISKIDKSIEVTKDKIKNSSEIEFLPDLYFALAELYADKSRLMYSYKLEANLGTPVEELDFTSEKRPKLDAIETYNTILDRYPNYIQRDRVLFSLAHEYREVSEIDKAIKVYKELLQKYPDSNLWEESQLIIGNIYFDKKDYQFAVEQFEKILVRPKSAIHLLANYRIGLCQIYLDQYLKSLMSFEKVYTNEDFKGHKLPQEYQKFDVREEALIASVWPLLDLTPQDLKLNTQYISPKEYYRKVSYDKQSYRRVLQRLAKRLAIKNNTFESAKVWYELMTLSDDAQMKKDALESFYLNVKQSKKEYFPADISFQIRETLLLLKEEGMDYFKYESVLRDVSTQLHKLALKTKRKEDFLRAIDSYLDYFWIFPKTQSFEEMKVNLAESYYFAELFSESGKVYLFLAKSNHQSKSKEHLESSLQAFTEGLKDSTKLNPLQKIQSRYGYRLAALSFLKKYPNDKDAPNVYFNLAKTYYDEQLFNETVKLFRSYLKKYPNDTKIKQATLLLLDAYYVKDDIKGLVSEGNSLLKEYALPGDVKKQVQDLMQQSQMKKVKSLAGDFSSKEYADKFMAFAKKNKNSNLAEGALAEAFSSMKANYDQRLFEVGEQYISQFGQSAKAKEILLSMIQMSLITLDFNSAVNYLLAFTQKYQQDTQSKDFLLQAGQIAEQIGNVEDAVQSFTKLGDFDRVAKIYFEHGDWNKLLQVSSKVNGLKGVYYLGLSQFRLGKKEDGLNSLRRTSSESVKDFDEKTMLAHSNYILINAEIEQFKSSSGNSEFTPQHLKEKISKFNELDRQIQELINLGVPRWTISSLYLLGHLNKDFSEFLKNVNPPKSMSIDSLRKMLNQQIENYSKSSKAAFSQCLMLAEENDVFTRFVEGCRTEGVYKVDEAVETTNIFKVTKVNYSKDYLSMKEKLFKEPRNIELLNKIVLSLVKMGDYATAMVTLTRLQEIEPQNNEYLAQQGVLRMFMNDYSGAQAIFKEILNKDTQNKISTWGMYALCKKFGFTKKAFGFQVKAKSLGKPNGVVHPWMFN